MPLLMQGTQEPPGSLKDAATSNQQPPSSMSRHRGWLLMVALNIFFSVSGQTAATLLGRFYYSQGGNSKWMTALVQSAGAPLLYPLLFFQSPSTPPLINITHTFHVSASKLAFIYISLGLILAGDNLMYSYGLLYLPISTYSLIDATQLAFSAIFSYFLNAQRFTSTALNSVVLLTFSAALLGFHSTDSEDTGSISKGMYALGFMLTLGASAAFSLFLSLMQLTFEKVLKGETLSVVLEVQMYTNCIAALASVIGLFASGEWRGLKGEMEGFGKGKLAYVMALVWTAISWEVASVGTVGLIFEVSSLFSNMIGTISLPMVPIFAVIFFHDRMDGIKVMAMLIAIWGFLSYIYQHYLDDSKDSEAKASEAKEIFELSDAL